MGNVTQIIADIKGGDERAADQLLKVVYEELRALARRRISNERPGHTLQPTALVHEAYLRLLGDEGTQWDGRAHFYAAAAEAMRRILVEAARRKGRLKHGGGRERFELSDADWIAVPASIDLVALDEALSKLAQTEKTKADLVKLRYFGGFTVEEAGKVLGISRATADRHWAYARAWLYTEISKGDDTLER